MLEAVFAAHHGWPIFPANGDSAVGVLTVSSSYVRFGMKSDKKVSNKSPMGLISYSIQGVFEIAFGGGICSLVEVIAAPHYYSQNSFVFLCVADARYDPPP